MGADLDGHSDERHWDEEVGNVDWHKQVDHRDCCNVCHIPSDIKVHHSHNIVPRLWVRDIGNLLEILPWGHLLDHVGLEGRAPYCTLHVDVVHSHHDRDVGS